MILGSEALCVIATLTCHDFSSKYESDGQFPKLHLPDQESSVNRLDHVMTHTRHCKTHTQSDLMMPDNLVQHLMMLR